MPTGETYTQQEHNYAGITQEERLLHALLPDSVKVDERTLQDLMAFVLRYSRLILHYNKHNDVSGDWEKFFATDISFYLAEIASTKTDELDQRATDLWLGIEQGDTANASMMVTDFIQLEFDIARIMDGWYTKLRAMNRTKSGVAVGLENEIENTIQHQTSISLRGVLEINQFLIDKNEIALNKTLLTEGFNKIWGFESTPQTPLPTLLETAPDGTHMVDAVRKLRILFNNIHNALNYFIVRAKDWFLISLQSADHPPHTGLMISFLKLYQHAQTHINELSERHLSFYFEHILRQHKRNAQPDISFVAFELNGEISPFTLYDGTELTGPNPDAESFQEIEFKTKDPLTLSPATIESLKTLYVTKHPLTVGKDKSSTYQLISNLYVSPVANSKDGKGTPFVYGENASWALFGQDESVIPPDERKLMPGTMGFAISDPIFLLEEGERQITIIIKFDRDTIETYLRLLRDNSKHANLSREQAFYRMFSEAFRISATGKKGWIDIHNVEITPPENHYEPELHFTLTLEPDKPAIKCYDKEIYGDDYDSEYPIVRFMLNNDSPVFPVSMLMDIEIYEINIEVEVKGIKKIQAYTETGTINSGKPFQPFGALPVAGSYLLAGHEELFRKKISELSFDFDWFNLPKIKGGLKKHYEHYESPYDNDEFLIAVSALSKNTFMPQNARQASLYRLFETHAEDGSLSSKTHVSIDNLPEMMMHVNPDFEMPTDYNNQTLAGFFKFELVNPPYAFGHEQYPKLYTKIVMENAAAEQQPLIGIKLRDKEPLPLPEPPVTPMMSAMSINYKSSLTIEYVPSPITVAKADRLPHKIFHIHPFGVVNTFNKGKASNRKILPTYDEAAYLFIGLRSLTPKQELSFLFHLDESEPLLYQGVPPIITWYYLVNDEWLPFRPDQIISDSTDSFTRSGIVRIQTSSEIATGNRSFSPDLHWISITLRKHYGIAPRVKNILLNAVTVERTNYDADVSHFDSIPAGTLISLKDYNPDISAVIQPMASFGGKNRETERAYLSRVSERLRHKMRAVTAWDYERLILEKFPEVNQVKCLTYNGNEHLIPYGSILIVVAPSVTQLIGTLSEPKFNASLLTTIQDYVKTLASPFARIQVINPDYDKLKITCSVVFSDTRNQGNYINRLNRDIQEYIAPWMFGKGQKLSIGGSISRNDLLTFIGNLPYVQFITKLSIVQVYRQKGLYDLNDTARDVSASPIIKASKPWSVLTPFERQPLGLLDREAYQYPEPTGIDTMIIGADFIVKEKPNDMISAADDIPPPPANPPTPSQDDIFLDL